MSQENTTCACRYRLLRLDDQKLLRLCSEERFLGSGKGGQKRNKTRNAVRLRLMEFSAESSKHRSLALNRRETLRKIRLAIALDGDDEGWKEFGDGLPSDKSALIAGLPTVNEANPRFPIMSAVIIDVLRHCGSWYEAAQMLAVSSGRLRKWVERSPRLTKHVKEIIAITPKRSRTPSDYPPPRTPIQS